jgi:hypothetical protein
LPGSPLVDLLRHLAGAPEPDGVGGVEADGRDRQQDVYELESQVEQAQIKSFLRLP